jgi:hypothetical protein
MRQAEITPMSDQLEDKSCVLVAENLASSDQQAPPDIRSRWTIDIVLGKWLGIMYCVASGNGLASGVEITMPEKAG